MKPKKTTYIKKKPTKKLGPLQKLWESPQLDGPSKNLEKLESYAPQLEGWILICGLFGYEKNGLTRYYSKSVSKYNIEKCWSLYSQQVEIMMLPDPYNEFGGPDMYLYMRKFKYTNKK